MTDTQEAADNKQILPEENPFYLSDSEIKEITSAVQAQDFDTVNGFLKDLSPADEAELLSKVNDVDRQELLAMYGEHLNPETFTEMDDELCRASLSSMPVEDVASIISKLESDDALDVVENLDDELQEEIFEKLSAKTRAVIQEGLSFPEESAGRLMQREFVAIPQFWSVGKTIDYLRENAEDLPEDFFDIYVISPSYHVMGVIPLGKLIRSARAVKIDTLSLKDTYPIHASMDQEEAAHIFRRENLVSAPVVDDHDRIIGVITIDDIIDVIDEEAQEDILLMAGVDQGDLYRAVLSTTSTRFRWLFINLITAILASAVISFFDATIEQIVALAVLMPIVASMGGNAGTQALTVAVRALASKQLSSTNAWRVIWKETLVGTLNGAAFAVITGLVAGLWFGSTMLGCVIALAMVVNLFVAGAFGAGIPILLDKMGSDPAISSTVFLTTVTDVVGFFAFLGLAALMLL